MKVFLDTNVLVSALTTRGSCADLFREVLESHELLTSQQVLEELEEVLSKKMGMTPAAIRGALDLLRTFHVEPTPKQLPSIKLRDTDDLAIIAAALASRANVLVTGDKDLLDASAITGLPILSPRGFFELLSRPQ